jgi:branched-chain amino acid transport system permease protein
MNARARLRIPPVTSMVARRWDRLPRPARWALYLLAFVGALLLPNDAVAQVMAPQSDWGTILFYPIAIYILLALGLNVVVGMAGLLDLGYVAFFAIGAYSMALLNTVWNWNFWVILPVGIAIAAVSGVILGAPTLRLRGDYLAIVTLGFGEIVRITATNTEWTGGPRGISNIAHPPDIGDSPAFQYGVIDPKPYYYLAVVFIVVVIVVVKQLERSRVGRAWAAIREDEEAAALMGVPTFLFKLWAFTIGACVGGMTGVLWASKVIAITPDNFQLILSILILSAVILGGAGNVPGVILGAFLVAWLPERFRGLAEYRVLIFGALLVVMMIFRPGGLLPSRQRQAEFEEGTAGGSGTLGAQVDAEQRHAAPAEVD